MKFKSITSHSGTLYGLSEEGDIWFKTKGGTWKQEIIVTEGCPNCGQAKNNPRVYSKADGHGGLNKQCEHMFHKNRN